MPWHTNALPYGPNKKLEEKSIIKNTETKKRRIQKQRSEEYRNKETKKQRNKETKKQTKKQRNKETKKQRNKETKKQPTNQPTHSITNQTGRRSYSRILEIIDTRWVAYLNNSSHTHYNIFFLCSIIFDKKGSGLVTVSSPYFNLTTNYIDDILSSNDEFSFIVASPKVRLLNC